MLQVGLFPNHDIFRLMPLQSEHNERRHLASHEAAFARRLVRWAAGKGRGYREYLPADAPNQIEESIRAQ